MSNVASPHKPVVLVVDDDDDLRDTLCDWLTRAGYPVRPAGDGLEALAIAEREPVHVVVTDFQMPRLDGLGLLEGVRERHPGVQVIFLTGQATKELAIEALRQGRSFDFLEKPLHDMRVLAQLIDQAWASRPAAGPAAAPAVRLPQALAEACGRSPLLAKVFGHVAANLADPLSLPVVADAVGYHPVYLTEAVRRESGQTLARWITELRMREAQRLLETHDWPISQVAAAVGFHDPSHFARLFKQFSGEAPNAWREHRQQA